MPAAPLPRACARRSLPHARPCARSTRPHDPHRLHNPMSKQIAFLGLGVMGFPIAGHLASAGHRVTVYNRTPAKAAQWVAQHKNRSAPTPAAAAADADLVLMCVGNDDDVRAVVLGADGALGAMKQGTTLVDHTTASATV